MITIQLTPQQFFYLKSAVERDREGLEDMAPWDIDGQQGLLDEDLRRNAQVSTLLSRVEQEQVVTH
jgi:hypothetical protein